jgi:hypothetical protein
LTPEDDAARSPRHLRSTQAWLLGGLVALSSLNSIFAGIAASQDVRLSESTQILWWFVFSILVAVWLKNDIVERGSDTSRQYPHFVLFLFWPLLLPYQLIASRGLEGVVLFLGFAATYMAPYLVQLVVWCLGGA